MPEREGVIQNIYSSRCQLILELFGVITSPEIHIVHIFHFKAVVKDAMCAASLSSQEC